MEKKYNYVYLTTNIVNGKQYVGDRSCDCLPKKDKYLGSGKLFLKKINEYGKENFEKKILEFYNTKQEAFNAQEKYINEYNTLVPRGYNISPKGGSGVKNWFNHYEETKKKIGEANKFSLKGMKRSEESKLKQSETNKGHSVSDETRKKMRKLNLGKNNPMFGKKQTKESNEKRSKSLRGHSVSDETREKIRKSNTGTIMSEESKEKNRQAHLGKKHSEETKQKMREAWQKRKQREL